MNTGKRQTMDDLNHEARSCVQLVQSQHLDLVVCVCVCVLSAGVPPHQGHYI